MTRLAATTFIQCQHNGLTGSFLRDAQGVLHSPIFADSADLYRFCEARGWLQDAERREGWSARFRNDDATALIAVSDLYPGDMLDLEGDPFADKTEDGAPNPFEFEKAVVESVEPETADCTLVTSELVNCGFPPDHKVKVNGFEGRMVDAVTGKPATLIINGVSIV